MSKGSKNRSTKKYAENFDDVFRKVDNLIYPLEYDLLKPIKKDDGFVNKHKK